MNGIERHESGTTFTGQGIAMLRLTTMLRCLGMEMRGIRMVRHSVYAQVKRELGFRGNKQLVVYQLAAHIRTLLAQSEASASDIDALLEGSR